MLRTPSESCVHYWILESPNGPYSYGRCRKCGGERKDFRNAYENMPRIRRKIKNHKSGDTHYVDVPVWRL